MNPLDHTCWPGRARRILHPIARIGLLVLFAAGPLGRSSRAAEASSAVLTEEFVVEREGEYLNVRIILPPPDRLAAHPLLLLNFASDRQTSLTDQLSQLAAGGLPCHRQRRPARRYRRLRPLRAGAVRKGSAASARGISQQARHRERLPGAYPSRPMVGRRHLVPAAADPMSRAVEPSFNFASSLARRGIPQGSGSARRSFWLR